MPHARIPRHYIRGFKGEDRSANYILNLGKSYLWTCLCNRMKPYLSHFKRINKLINKYQTERYISLKLNNSNLLKRKWKMLEGTNLV